MQTRRILGCALLALAVSVPAWAIKNKLKYSETLNITLANCSLGSQRFQDDTAFGTGSSSYYFTDDGGSFADDTTDAGDAGTGDITIWPGTPAVNDAIYYGSDDLFNQLRFDIGTQGSTVMTVIWEYSDSDSTFATLTQTRSDVNQFEETTGDTHFNHWTPPSDWTKQTINSQSAYWLRQRITAFTSTTTPAVGDQFWLGDINDVSGKHLIVSSDSDESEDLWCGCTGAEAVNVGKNIKSATGVWSPDVQDNAYECFCCGDGGSVDVSVEIWEENI